MIQGIGQKIVEWAVIAALVGVIGYLIGNSDAMMMKSEIASQREVNTRQALEIEALEVRLDALSPRVERLVARDEFIQQMEGGK